MENRLDGNEVEMGGGSVSVEQQGCKSRIGHEAGEAGRTRPNQPARRLRLHGSEAEKRGGALGQPSLIMSTLLRLSGGVGQPINKVMSPPPLEPPAISPTFVSLPHPHDRPLDIVRGEQVVDLPTPVTVELPLVGRPSLVDLVALGPTKAPCIPPTYGGRYGLL